ncbi:hypothetical protein [Natronoarchaeum rubrum]|uniref:hypothetical protein n=1 Tax=Natronoarchaeum rubrum TaxID=755311 RepID=UPI002112E3A6|nr:hypothetical protein [Natronoarchaeum rubrum]
MGVSPASLDRSFRESIRSGYNNAVAFLTLSLLGALATVPVATVGHAVFGVTYAVGVILARGTPHTAREAAGLFAEGVRRNAATGALLTAAIAVAGAVLAGNVLVITSPSAAVALVALAVVSTALIAAGLVVLVVAVALVACGQSVRAGVRDAAVLVASNPGYALVIGLVVASLLALGALTLGVGWAVVGFSFTAGFVLLATAHAYEERAGENPLEALAGE